MTAKKTFQSVENLPGGRKETPLGKIEGHRAFCAKWGCSLAQLKLAKEKGCPGFHAGNRLDPVEIIPFMFRLLLSENAKGKKVQSLSEAQTAKVEAETRRIEREEALENKVIQSENYIDQKYRHEILMPERDRLQGLKKKYHRFKAIQPDIAQKILEVDLPELLERLRLKTEKQDEHTA